MPSPQRQGEGAQQHAHPAGFPAKCGNGRGGGGVLRPSHGCCASVQRPLRSCVPYDTTGRHTIPGKGKWFTLSCDDWTIVAAGRACSPIMQGHVGHRLDEAFGPSFDHYRHLYEQARDHGSSGGVVFDPHYGVLRHMRVQRQGDRLLCCYEHLPIHGLRQALDDAEAWLQSQEGGRSAPQSDGVLESRARGRRPFLRLVAATIGG